MEKRVAVIYTGEVRTIETTIKYFRENVLINNNFHVFATLQSNNIEYFDNFVKENIGEHLKSIVWLDKNDEKWISIREDLLNKMDNVSDRWKDYLKNSGSMIEYYQIYLAYKNIEEYEKTNSIKYDYIMRIRCDVVLTHPIYFNWDDYSVDIVKEMLYEIKNEKNVETIVSQKVFVTFMNSFYHKNRMLCKNIWYGNNHFSEAFKHIINIIDTSGGENNEIIDINTEDRFINAVYQYLLNGKYAVTLRKNQIFFMKRELFTNIAELGVTYGAHTTTNNDWWFNAESQLEIILIENGIDIFESENRIEGDSIYSYNEHNYFENNELKKTHEILFFIKRH
jgi:hypothetical protein